uniref:ATP synthase complex subunit 8 n=1 Tax=Anthribidae sp. 9 ACP-2013 TaxID=1434436 RepID=A0A3G5FNV3_9CUCU|nr:ATP synthase F0 subunit 8 [Anthribidae sp. 9 ACP-2013]
MPQMAPLNWLTLFLFFTLIFLMFNIINYFIFSSSPFMKPKMMNKKKINWKW